MCSLFMYGTKSAVDELSARFQKRATGLDVHEAWVMARPLY